MHEIMLCVHEIEVCVDDKCTRARGCSLYVMLLCMWWQVCGVIVHMVAGVRDVIVHGVAVCVGYPQHL